MVFHMRFICRRAIEGSELDLRRPTAKRAAVRRHVGGLLQKLLHRCHPKTGALLEMHRNADGTLWNPGWGTYTYQKVADEVDRFSTSWFLCLCPRSTS